jgi:small conductance mechanosensitive channel
MELLEQAQELTLIYGLNMIGAIVILFVGRWFAGLTSKFVARSLSKTSTNEALLRFLSRITYYGILAFAVVAALARLGVQTASFIAVLGAAGLAIGLALEGALANFASGVIILLFKPFGIGHLVEVGDVFGKVEDIQIFSTIIVTPDNKTVIIPNGQITSSHIVNYTRRGTLRVDMTFGIAYSDDLLKAKKLLEQIVTADERVLADPAPMVAVSELGDSSVNFAVRPYVNVADYWAAYFAIHEAVKLRFDEAGISIPFPQRDVHLFQSN